MFLRDLQLKLVFRRMLPHLDTMLFASTWTRRLQLAPVSKVLFAMVAALSCVSAFSASAGEIVVADGGKSAYQIVVADDASPSTKHGAEELQKFLEEMTGAKLPIVSDKQPQSPKEIVLGDNAHFKALKTDIDVASLGKEGYVIRTVGDTLVIVGGALRGNMYGVYGLLEDHLGCRWFTPDCSRIPKMPKLALAELNDRQIPTLEYREPFVMDCYDGDWCARNRVNSSAGRLEAKHGGKIYFAGGFFCHTFFSMVPPAQYFAEHPEYYSLINGKRVTENAQLCCTNPDVIRICTERVREAMKAQPDATVFSVSQNDCGNQCQCDQCQALAKEEDSQMAPVLQLVNKVAEAVEKDFPNQVVETLAYQWTRKAPKTMKPRPNVVIRFCSIECCFSHPLATCDSSFNKAFRDDMEAWAKVAPRLWVWDYATNFAGYMYPFPNQRVRGPNVKYFAEHNVKGMFEQDTYQTLDGEFSALGGYITAKSLWNPNYDSNVAMNEFLEAYYGKAAGSIRAYLDCIHDYMEQKDVHVGIFFGAEHACLADELLISADPLMQQAEAAAGDDPTSLHRVKIARMSLDFAILERSRLEAAKKLPLNEKLAALAKMRFQPFAETLKKSAFTQLNEGQVMDKDAYLNALAKDLGLNKTE
jgi:hypothetical protein